MVDISRMPRFQDTPMGKGVDDFINRALGILKDTVEGAVGLASESLGGLGESARGGFGMKNVFSNALGAIMGGGNEAEQGAGLSRAIEAPSQAVGLEQHESHRCNSELGGLSAPTFGCPAPAQGIEAFMGGR